MVPIRVARVYPFPGRKLSNNAGSVLFWGIDAPFGILTGPFPGYRTRFSNAGGMVPGYGGVVLFFTIPVLGNSYGVAQPRWFSSGEEKRF